MDVREGHHATGCRAPRDHAIPIDHPYHEDHDPARERMKGGVRIGGTVVAGTVVVGTVGAGVFGLGGERVARAKGNLDANGVLRPAGGWLQCSSGMEVACACVAASSCRHVQLMPRQQLLQQQS
jgi:hypothetical protein